MIYRDPALAHPLLELLIGDRISYRPAYRPQENLPLKVPALEVDQATSPPPHAQ